jgi:hypothetical protein
MGRIGFVKSNSPLSHVTVLHDVMKAKTAFSCQVVAKSKPLDNFYEAQHQVLKAIRYSQGIRQINPKNTLLYPVIVYEGNMFECYVHDDALQVSQIDHVCYLSGGIPEDATPTYIDVMTLDYFPKYLADVEAETKRLAAKATDT